LGLKETTKLLFPLRVVLLGQGGGAEVVLVAKNKKKKKKVLYAVTLFYGEKSLSDWAASIEKLDIRHHTLTDSRTPHTTPYHHSRSPL